jgi:hypothetical protein
LRMTGELSGKRERYFPRGLGLRRYARFAARGSRGMDWSCDHGGRRRSRPLTLESSSSFSHAPWQECQHDPKPMSRRHPQLDERDRQSSGAGGNPYIGAKPPPTPVMPAVPPAFEAPPPSSSSSSMGGMP